MGSFTTAILDTGIDSGGCWVAVLENTTANAPGLPSALSLRATCLAHKTLHCLRLKVQGMSASAVRSNRETPKMKAALVHLIALAGLGTARSVVLDGASALNSPRLDEKALSAGTQVVGATTNSTRVQRHLASRGGLDGCKKRAGGLTQTPKTTSQDRHEVSSERLAPQLQPNSAPWREHEGGSETASLGKRTNKETRQDKTLPELAKAALLKLQNLSGDRSTRTLVTADILLPFARSALEQLKKWNNVIGQSVKAFDDAVADLQQAIGGKPVPEIFGNELKLRMICFLRDDPMGANGIDIACQRLRGQDEQSSAEEENTLRNALSQVFEDCAKASQETSPAAADNQDIHPRQKCDELSRKTLELGEATEALIELRKEVRQRLKDGGQVERRDVDRAARLIRKGGFGTLNRKVANWDTKMAAWYLDDVVASAESKTKKYSPRVLPEWATKTRVAASEIPQSHVAEFRALRIIYEGPYRGMFESTEPVRDWDVCWSAAGLEESQPHQWDTLSAALTYLDSSLRVFDFACKVCECTWTQEFKLRCGLTETEDGYYISKKRSLLGGAF
ncbi:uncharacterized protein MAM_05726 [Metarhizium album ARSEF 1941]|uniref:Uncharacterized protein n=1 Tax=Metarhizium album (strain ARSEF 1941) TaxID=1081103 RepID=A0A0B2WSH7_METAS|nr:uncharacterized protein MAM_05726 [Metarhizium album ARSEF 1941]KHN96437.1 hypothetical protein MAM_05726 [Metarhizium album ARSEF 1941]